MRIFILLAAIIMLVGAAPTPSASGAPPEIQAADFFIGNWSCAHTFGDDGGTYTTRYEKVLGDAWIRQTYDFAPTRTEAALQGEWFFGFDGRRWVRFGAMSDGLYFAMLGTREDNKWLYSYDLPGKTAVETVYTKRSDTEYTVDGPTYPRNGKMVTEHHRCKKVGDP